MLTLARNPRFQDPVRVDGDVLVGAGRAGRGGERGQVRVVGGADAAAQLGGG